ncbi:hydantoinase/oxoprolinase family protein [Corynebacterium sp. TAE3-ERU16]|uniref:hydantoinase/oxoprolinase family protein n=1 Tax=Corynebacterium sp. TAE3-ERU16 TaxID=2849493 RepID=UPI001C48AB97|nr:hydantoinase/oxoprolinase family protein [Corynebacterium sp. TAE3-ERU16]MBV7293018.1 hydantoinase/oxoprolinase family protein [Corynebacterium sp. TAE3-ERU16]
MKHLINIDNGGTLTDVCVWDGDQFSFTKTLTTPFDLSECLFEGIAKASANLYDERDLVRLLHEADHIRYSTTQGTNALVERKGPSIGLLVEDPSVIDAMQSDDDHSTLFADLIGTRVETFNLSDDELEFSLVQTVNKLTTDGAARLVVVGSDAESERTVRNLLLRNFPRQLLGSVPVLCSWEFVDDANDARRAWSSVVNTFLHPVMERFLYQAQSRLRENKVTNPLLVYRNDGASSRVSKSVALRTYSSGPRGGLEGTAALARSYKLDHVLMMDVGGTTTDVGVVDGCTIDTQRRGQVGEATISFPMSSVHSSGVGGSSIISVRDGKIVVGPRSVGAAPGPACFGLGGKDATITDVKVLLGILDPGTYLNGQMHLDAARSRAVITQTIAEPLGISLEEALLRMEDAYLETMAETFRDLVRPDTTLAAFGGAGPMSACGAAEKAGVKRVLIPRMAAVFSAFGISFSDIGKTYEISVSENGPEGLQRNHDDLLHRAERDMFQEGYTLDECQTKWTIEEHDENGEVVSSRPYEHGEEVADSGHELMLCLDVKKVLPHASLEVDDSVDTSAATSTGTRTIRVSADETRDLPVYVLEDQVPGATAAGPAILEGPFFTARVTPGWEFTVTSNGDLIITDER